MVYVLHRQNVLKTCGADTCIHKENESKIRLYTKKVRSANSELAYEGSEDAEEIVKKFR